MRAGATAAEEGPYKDEDHAANSKSSNIYAKIDSVFLDHSYSLVGLAIGGIVYKLIPTLFEKYPSIPRVLVTSVLCA